MNYRTPLFLYRTEIKDLLAELQRLGNLAKSTTPTTKQKNNNFNRIILIFKSYKFKTNSVLLYFIFFALWQEFLQEFKAVADHISEIY